jgi:zinc transport system ATP-binding protein
VLLQAEGIDLSLGGMPVLHQVGLSLRPAEIVTIVGPNGSGKSTLLRVLIGALRPDRGRVLRQAGLQVGYVPQKLQIDPTLPITVRRFLDLPVRVPADRALAALADVGLPPGVLTRQLADLSGGQLQRVLLARAILPRPDLLILDEPTQGLDQPGAAQFYRLIAALRDKLGCGVLMVSHELHVVMAASDRVICLNGHVCCEGTPEHVSAAPAYRELFGTGTDGALALYRHDHDHHDHPDHHHHHHDAAE